MVPFGPTPLGMEFAHLRWVRSEPTADHRKDGSTLGSLLIPRACCQSRLAEGVGEHGDQLRHLAQVDPSGGHANVVPPMAKDERSLIRVPRRSQACAGASAVRNPKMLAGSFSHSSRIPPAETSVELPGQPRLLSGCRGTIDGMRRVVPWLLLGVLGLATGLGLGLGLAYGETEVAPGTTPRLIALSPTWLPPGTGQTGSGVGLILFPAPHCPYQPSRTVSSPDHTQSFTYMTARCPFDTQGTRAPFSSASTESRSQARRSAWVPKASSSPPGGSCGAPTSSSQVSTSPRSKWSSSSPGWCLPAAPTRCTKPLTDATPRRVSTNRASPTCQRPRTRWAAQVRHEQGRGPVREMGRTHRPACYFQT